VPSCWSIAKVLAQNAENHPNPLRPLFCLLQKPEPEAAPDAAEGAGAGDGTLAPVAAAAAAAGVAGSLLS
jgi:hypothetical protein